MKHNNDVFNATNDNILLSSQLNDSSFLSLFFIFFFILVIYTMLERNMNLSIQLSMDETKWTNAKCERKNPVIIFVLTNLK